MESQDSQSYIDKLYLKNKIKAKNLGEKNLYTYETLYI